jgi:MFS family permease
MAAGLCAMTVAAVPLLLLGWTPTVVLAMALNGAGIVGVNVGGATLVQRLTPRELLGRVNSAVNVTMLVPQTAAIAVGASLVDSVDFRLLLVAMAVLRMFSVALLLGRGREAPEPLEPAIVDASAATEAPSQR